MGEPISAGAAGIMAAGSIGAGAISGAGTKRAAKEAGRQNRLLYYMQRKDYLADRAHAEEYDSAAAQKQRLIAAGLNPYLMMENGSAGTAQSPSNIGAAPADVASGAPALAAGITGGINSAIELLYQRRDAAMQQKAIEANIAKTEAETETVKIGNDSLSARLLAELGVNKSRIRAALQEYRFNEQMNPVSLSTAQQNLETMKLNHEILGIEKTIRGLQSKKEGIALRYLEPELQLQYSEHVAKLGQMYTDHQISEQQLWQECVKTSRDIQDAAVHSLNPSEIRDLRKALYNEAISGSKLNTYHNLIDNPYSGAFRTGKTERQKDARERLAGRIIGTIRTAGGLFRGAFK